MKTLNPALTKKTIKKEWHLDVNVISKMAAKLSFQYLEFTGFTTPLFSESGGGGGGGYDGKLQAFAAKPTHNMNIAKCLQSLVSRSGQTCFLSICTDTSYLPTSLFA